MNWINIVAGFLVGEEIGLYLSNDSPQIGFVDGVIGAWTAHVLSSELEDENKSVFKTKDRTQIESLLKEIFPSGIMAKIKCLKDVNPKYREDLTSTKLKVIDNKFYQDSLLITSVYSIIEKYNAEGIRNTESIFKNFLADYKEVFDKNFLNSDVFFEKAMDIIKNKEPNLLSVEKNDFNTSLISKLRKINDIVITDGFKVNKEEESLVKDFFIQMMSVYKGDLSVSYGNFLENKQAFLEKNINFSVKKLNDIVNGVIELSNKKVSRDERMVKFTICGSCGKSIQEFNYCSGCGGVIVKDVDVVKGVKNKEAVVNNMKIIIEKSNQVLDSDAVKNKI